MKIKSLKPQHEDVFLDESPTPSHRLKTVSEDSYCAWEDAKLAQVEWISATKPGESDKLYRHTALNRSTRALLVGFNFYKLLLSTEGQPGAFIVKSIDGKSEAWVTLASEPIGEQWVRDNIQPASITEMYEWLLIQGGIWSGRIPDGKPTATDPQSDKPPTPHAEVKKGPVSVWEEEQKEAEAKAKQSTTEGELKN